MASDWDATNELTIPNILLTYPNTDVENIYRMRAHYNVKLGMQLGFYIILQIT